MAKIAETDEVKKIVKYSAVQYSPVKCSTVKCSIVKK